MIGSTIAHYRITAKLGEGGMGEVYRAADDRLNRDVAIKLLPDSVEQDPARLSRFRREAQLLAALTHGNIAQVYGLEEQDGRHAIVLELVEGEDLSERIARGALPLEDAREIALQIADALEAAHEKGIVHRDLKPANVKLAPDGTVKVLDFGLAKALSGDAAEQDISNSPTMTAAATQAGIILGTAAYMAPEQAKGKPVDRRADVWAFGCVLYEMLTGRAPFKGDGVSELLAHVITQEPDFEALPGDLPPQVADTIRRCLRKDPRMRLPDIAAARIALTESKDEPDTTQDSHAAPVPSAGWGPRVVLGVIGLIVGLALGWAWLGGGEGTSPSTTHLDLVLDPPPSDWPVAISPDGMTLVYAGGGERVGSLYARRLDGHETVQIPGTEGAERPVFSPDGTHVVFLAAGRLKRVSLSGGLPEPLCAVAGTITGVSWPVHDEIFFTTNATVVPHRVAASGGTPEPVAVQGLEPGIQLLGAEPLPDGSGLLVTMKGDSLESPRIAVLDLEDGSVTEVVRGSSPLLLGDDRLVYVQQGRVMLTAFDVARRSLSGPESAAPFDDPAVDRFEQVEYAHAFLSARGMLAYAAGEIRRSSRLLLVSPDGDAEETNLMGTLPRVDRAGRRVVAVDTDNEIQLPNFEDGSSIRLTFAAQSSYPIWSTDDESILFANNRTGNWLTYRISTDGQGETTSMDEDRGMTSVSISVHPNGTRMGYLIDPETSRDVFQVKPDGTWEMLLETPANERVPAISPDGTMFAYISDQEGSDQIYLRTLPMTERRWRVTTDGGLSPVWRRDGKALYFRDGDTIYEVELRTGAGVRVGEPRAVYTNALLDLDPWGNRTFDALPDGGLVVSVREASDVTLRVVLDWDN